MLPRTEAPTLLDLVQFDQLQQPEARRQTTRASSGVVRRLGARLKRARVQRGLSLRQFGVLTGINYETIRRVETGRVDPRWTVVVRLAQVLEVPITDLEPEGSGIQRKKKEQ